MNASLPCRVTLNLLLGLLLSLGARGQPALQAPLGEVWILPGEALQVEATGAPGREMRLEKGGLRLGLAEGPPGRFRGSFVLDSGRWWLSQGAARTPFGPVRVLQGRLPVARVLRPATIFRSGPDEAFDRLDPLPAGLACEVTGRQSDWFRLAPGQGWVSRSQVAVGAFVPSRPVVGSVHVEESPAGAAVVRVRLGEPAAWQVESDPEASSLVVRLPGARLAMGEVAYAPEPARVTGVRLQAGPEEVEVRLRLGPGGTWGYGLRWEPPDLLLDLSPPPAIDPARPLQGLRVVLDPGHGGPDRGAVGVGGLQEKDLNLAQALALRNDLEAAGAVVFMTREADREVAGGSAERELAARVELAERVGGQLFLSLHHNARGDVAEGRVSHGTHIYYYQPQSRALAFALAPALARSILEPDFMPLWRSFHVIRQTRMPAVLIESNFLSNPEVEARMREPDYLQASARGIRQGLETFLREAARH